MPLSFAKIVPAQPGVDLHDHRRSSLDDAERLDLLERIKLLDAATADEHAFDRISALAARTMKVPLALVSLVTDERQFFHGMGGKVSEGWKGERSTPLSHSFCQHVAISGEPLVIPDARENPLVRENLAVRDLGVIAYLGMPLTTASGQTLGSLCIIDDQPRSWTELEMETLRGLAALVMVEIELRLSRYQLQSRVTSMQVTEENRSDYTRLLVHDLRTPLNSLLLGLKALPHLGDLNVDQQEALEMALRGGKTLVALVDDMLDAAASEARGADSLRLSPALDPADLMAQAAAQVSSLAAHRGLTLAIEAAAATGDCPPLAAVSIEADAAKIVRALVNLLSNAVKFTPEGGRVSVWAQSQDGEASMIKFSVRDTGSGIAAQDHGRIFERFERLSPEQSSVQRSSGLGLFFVKTVAEAHGGRVEVESAPGRGSVFSLVIPCRQPIPRLNTGKSAV